MKRTQLDLPLCGDAWLDVRQRRNDRERLRATRDDSYEQQLLKLVGKRLQVLSYLFDRSSMGGTIKEVAAARFQGNSNWVTQPFKDLREARYIETLVERRDGGTVHRITERGRQAYFAALQNSTQTTIGK